MGIRGASARACANIALVKYWGKRDPTLNLPATGSLSLTVAGLTATARVEPAVAGAARFRRGEVPVTGVAGTRMAEYLDLLGRELGCTEPLAAEIEVNFPVAAGLASSAAIHCAVAAAAAAAAGAHLSRAELSALARRGSGSAARSVFGGIVEWARGERPDGRDSIARQVLPETDWDLALAIAVVSEAAKETASRDAMAHVARTSPFFPAWVDGQESDLAGARAAIAARDLDRLGTIAEENCFRMHATALAARPPILYWTSATLALVHEVRALRARGLRAYATIDAGPQVKVLCAGADVDGVERALAAVPGVLSVRRARLGPGVEVLGAEAPWS